MLGVKVIRDYLLREDFSLDGENLLRFLNQNPFYDHLSFKSIVPFIAYFVNQNNLWSAVDSQIRRELTVMLMEAEWINQKRRADLFAVCDAFAKRAIPAIPIKGAALSFLVYREYPFRIMWDVDLLIKEKDKQTARKLLEAEGFRILHSPSRYLGRNKIVMDEWKRIVFIKDDAAVDLHWGICYEIAHRIVEWDSEGAWNRSVVLDVQGRSMLLLAPRDQVIVLWLHLLDAAEQKKALCVQLLDWMLVMDFYKLKADDLRPELDRIKDPVARKKCCDFLDLLQPLIQTIGSSEGCHPHWKKLTELFFPAMPSENKSHVYALRLMRKNLSRLRYLFGFLLPNADCPEYRMLRKRGGPLAVLLFHGGWLLKKSISSLASMIAKRISKK